MIFEIFLWLIAISFSVYGFIHKDQSLLGYLSFAIVLYGLSILTYDSVFKGIQYDHPLDGLSTGIILVWLISTYITSVSFLKTENILSIDWRFITVFPIISGIGNILGALFFGYHSAQYITGSVIISLSIAFLIMEKYPKVESFSILSIIMVNLVFLGYLAVNWMAYAGQINEIPNMIIKFSGIIIFSFLFFWVYLNKFKIITNKQANILLRGCFTLFVASILFHRPEIPAFLNMDKAEDIIKSILAFGEIGTVVYVATKSAFAYKYIS